MGAGAVPKAAVEHHEGAGRRCGLEDRVAALLRGMRVGAAQMGAGHDLGGAVLRAEVA